MDSGNSGSMQSSSGGDEEFDSRAESIAAFFGNSSNPTGRVGPVPNPPQPSEHHRSSTSPSIFDPLSNYFDPLSSASRSSGPTPLTNPNSLLNLDVWSKNLRSEANCTDLGGFMALSPSPTQQLFTNQTQGRTTFPSVQIPSGVESATRVSISGSNVNDKINNSVSSSHNNTGRNPKKRCRASRRAPTTVLTTDTTNFRAMVQEFTGIPAPPFTSSAFPISRLDLFATAASTLRSAATHFDPQPPPPYLLRPFAQKVQPQPQPQPQPPPPAPPFLSLPPPLTSASLSTSIIIDAIAPTTTTNITSASTSNSSTSVNHQLPSDSGLLKLQPQSLLDINMQNPVLKFPSLHQGHPNKYPLPNSTILGSSKPPQGSFELPSNDSHLKIAGLEDFGLSQGHVRTNITGLQNIVSSSSSDTPLRRTDGNPANWADGVSSNEGDHQGLLRTNINNGNYNNSSQRATNGKVNYLASSSDFRGDKGPENVPTRSEGMVESWICSSD